MQSWNILCAYLWRNTLNRWFEQPAAPISKFLIPLILTLLSCAVVIVFNTLETKLIEQLRTSNIYSIAVTANHSSVNTELQRKLSYEEEAMLQLRYGKENITYIRQPYATATIADSGEKLPMIVATLPFQNAYPEIIRPLILSTSPVDSKLPEDVQIGEITITAEHQVLPPSIGHILRTDRVLMIPPEISNSAISRGFTSHIFAELNTLSEVEHFQNAVPAYFKAQNIQFTIYSSLELLKEIESYQAIQQKIRLYIVLACSFMIALVLGSIAWLEYLKEAYLIALLKSFGIPNSLLALHIFIENFILVLLGILTSICASSPLLLKLSHHVPELSRFTQHKISLQQTDSYILITAGLLGVLLAMIPILFNLRKPAGTILQ